MFDGVDNSHVGFDDYEINDYKDYNNRMAKSMYDKLWFLERVEWQNIRVVVDYGCANGEMIIALAKMFPNTMFIGYDISAEMIQLARENFVQNSDNALNEHVLFTNNLDTVTSLLSPGHSMLICSSILHEIYAYSTESEIENFWDWVNLAKFNTIAIRDMLNMQEQVTNMLDSELCQIDNILTESHINKYWLECFHYWSMRKHDLAFIIHKFLLTRSYKKNWAREMRENYLTTSPVEVYQKLFYTYDVEYSEKYQLPYFMKQLTKDFPTIANMYTYDTHYKMLLTYRAD